jgi:hypothetical protein
VGGKTPVGAVSHSPVRGASWPRPCWRRRPFVSAREDAGISRSGSDAAGVVERLLEGGNCERDGTRVHMETWTEADTRPVVEMHADLDALAACRAGITLGEQRRSRRSRSPESIGARTSSEVPGGPIRTPLDNAVGHNCWNIARLPVARGARAEEAWHATARGMLTRPEETLGEAPSRAGRVTSIAPGSVHGFRVGARQCDQSGLRSSGNPRTATGAIHLPARFSV